MIQLPHPDKKIALVSSALPPSQSGQPMVLNLLLKDLHHDAYILITQHNFDTYWRQGTLSKRLPARYFFLHPEYQLQKIFLRIGAVLKTTVFLKVLFKVEYVQLRRIVDHQSCTGIVACTGGPFLPACAFLTAKKLKIPFYFYIFDLYSENSRNVYEKDFLHSYEPAMCKEATAIFVPNEFLARHYNEKYGITPIIIRNPCDLSRYQFMQGEERGALVTPSSEEISIVYTGMVYEAHYDAFRNLVKAIGYLKNPTVQLHIYTSQLFSKLMNKGISGPVVYHESEMHLNMPSVQQKAGILFLPLAFDSEIPLTITTSSPGKIGEYLASGRPILVHAPEDSFLSDYFSTNECGVVVNKNDPEVLCNALNNLISDIKLQEKIISNAKICAIRDFDVNVSREKFFSVLFSDSRT